jgi:hypothetical protein
MRSHSSLASETDTVRRRFARPPSPASFLTVSSLPTGALSSKTENTLPIPSSCSLLNFNLFDGLAGVSVPRRSRSCNDPGEDWEASSLQLCNPVLEAKISKLEASLQVVNADLSIETPVAQSPTVMEPDGVVSSDKELDYNGEHSNESSQLSQAEEGRDGVQDLPEQSSDQLDEISPFSRWIKTLRKRSMHRSIILQNSGARWTLDDFDLLPRTPQHQLGFPSNHRKTPSTVSSLAFITAVKSASITLASLSIHPRSRKSMQTNHWQEHQQPRGSIDSMVANTIPLMDDNTWARSVQRRRIIEEIVTSEESYIRDMKTLINVPRPMNAYSRHAKGRFLGILHRASSERARPQSNTQISYPNSQPPRGSSPSATEDAL